MISAWFMLDVMASMEARYTAFSSVMSETTLPYTVGLATISALAVEGSSMYPFTVE